MNAASSDPSTTESSFSAHMGKLEKFYNNKYKNGIFSNFYCSLLAHRYNLLINDQSSVLEIGCGEAGLLAKLKGVTKCGVDLSQNAIRNGSAKNPELELHCSAFESFANNGRKWDVIVASDLLNTVFDVQTLLERLHSFSHEKTIIIINVYNTLWQPFLRIARLAGLASHQPRQNWLSRSDINNLCALADWEVINSFGYALIPAPIPWLAGLVNRWLSPLFPWACLTIFLVARRANLPRREPKLVSVVVPARNEAGSIRDVLERVPRLGEETELIIIEGNSTDNTWQVIQHLPDVFHAGRIVKLKQTGKGKGNAVREAFAHAKGDIVTILDADLTMPPEDLPKYIEVLASRKADFANGVRLVYPMDDQAMQFANLCANKGFSLIFSWLLGQPVKDTLCGTKAMWREDYQKLDANRAFFGDFDPFGDFDLLFGADKLNLKIRDVPIRYKERFYGQTNISRWKHGVILLGMVLFAAKRLKFV
jgi:hypothetical protein